MPTYDYECKACGHEFEQFQSITAGALRKCPSCGKLKLRRLIGAGAGIIFKGSGFYETDYKRRSAPACAGTDRESSASSDASSSDNGKASGGEADKSPSGNGKVASKKKKKD